MIQKNLEECKDIILMIIKYISNYKNKNTLINMDCYQINFLISNKKTSFNCVILLDKK